MTNTFHDIIIFHSCSLVITTFLVVGYVQRETAVR